MKKTSLKEYIEVGALDKVKECLAAFPDQKNASLHRFGWTPVHLAVEYHKLEILKYLIETENADIRHLDNAGSTLLHHAFYFTTSKEEWDIIKYLLDSKKFKFDTLTDDNGNTTLHLAFKNCNLKQIADLNVYYKGLKDVFQTKNANKQTPLAILKERVKGSPESMAIVQKLQEDIEGPDALKEEDKWDNFKSDGKPHRFTGRPRGYLRAKMKASLTNSLRGSDGLKSSGGAAAAAAAAAPSSPKLDEPPKAPTGGFKGIVKGGSKIAGAAAGAAGGGLPTPSVPGVGDVSLDSIPSKDDLKDLKKEIKHDVKDVKHEVKDAKKEIKHEIKDAKKEVSFHGHDHEKGKEKEHEHGHGHGHEKHHEHHEHHGHEKKDGGKENGHEHEKHHEHGHEKEAEKKAEPELLVIQKQTHHHHEESGGSESESDVADSLCENCDAGNKASRYCEDCDTTLCKECLESHSKLKVMKGHNVIGLLGQCQSCEGGFRPTHYCQDCACDICEGCFHDHKRLKVTKEHVVITLAEKRELGITDEIIPVTGKPKDGVPDFAACSTEKEGEKAN